jgi:hypothetical protein
LNGSMATPGARIEPVNRLCRRGLGIRSILLLFIASGTIGGAQPDETFTGAAHPRADAWPGRQVALLIQYAPFVFSTGDSPRVVLYDDGTILRGDLAPSGEMRYLVGALKADEFRHLRESIGPTAAFRALKDTYNLAPDIADLPSVAVILTDRSGYKAVGVIGYSLYGPPRSSGLAGALRADSLPQEFDRLCKLLLSVKARNAVPWVPRYAQVFLRPAGNSGEPALSWPARWPTLTDRLAFREQGAWSVILNGSNLEQLRTLAEQHRAIGIDGKNWTISWLPVIPGSTLAKRIEARLLKR